MRLVRKYLLLIVTAVICVLIVVWKLCGITGDEMIFSFISIWLAPIDIAFASGLTMYRNKLNIITLVIAAALTVVIPLWCFGTYKLLTTAMTVFCAILGAATSAMFVKIRHSMK